MSEQRCFDGIQGFYRHDSRCTATPMRFAVFLPPQVEAGPVPVLYYLAGLTCTEETATIKAGAQRYAAQAGLALVMPDTSPRGAGIEGEDVDWDFGTAAGFYVDATEAPWSEHYLMYSYVTTELRELVESSFSVDASRCGIFGHSMGGHGALTIALREPERYRSVSAFAPICAPTQCPWGQKAFGGYLGPGQESWQAHDATALVAASPRADTILIDQGSDDQFLAEQLHPHLFAAACETSGQKLELRHHAGYDHSYYFIQSFVADHIAHHAAALA